MGLGREVESRGVVDGPERKLRNDGKANAASKNQSPDARGVTGRHLSTADPPMYRIEYDPAPPILLETEKRLFVVEISGNLLPKGLGVLPQTNRDVGLEIAERVGIQVPCDVRELAHG
jgi:hypothetical protein